MSNKPKYKDINDLCEKIKNKEENQTLSDLLDEEDICLPDGIAYKVGEKLDDEKMNANQLRKCFAMIKAAENIDDVVEARKKLYGVLPLIAYSAGRDLCPKDFYKLMAECISASTLKSLADIKTFIQFMEAIVAYSKYIKRVGK